MDEKTKLILGLMQVENLLILSKNFDYSQYLVKHLAPVRYELRRQLTNLDKTYLSDYN